MHKHEFFENGLKAVIFEAYLFPYGDTFTGELYDNENLLFRTIKNKSFDECKSVIMQFIDGQISDCMSKANMLRTLNEKMENYNGQI